MHETVTAYQRDCQIRFSPLRKKIFDNIFNEYVSRCTYAREFKALQISVTSLLLLHVFDDVVFLTFISVSTEHASIVYTITCAFVLTLTTALEWQK